jgi:rSAM/selenodomain-associated transferase 2
VPTPTISVLIPTLNEDGTVERALLSTRVPGVEQIVADGGSTDGTLETVRRLGADRVIRSEPGRARQMDAAYRAAGGEVLLFLHADTRLDPGWATQIQQALEDVRVAGGAFTLRFDSDRPIYRWIERGARLRARVARLPYGDQGIFVRRKVVDAQEGIAETPIFEDLDLVRTIRRAGRIVVLPAHARTSARRYDRNGPVRTVVRNGLALAAYSAGIDRTLVAHWYRRPAER